jgi:fibronectin type 3 domain-containing protein
MRLAVEALEDRTLPSTSATPFYVIEPAGAAPEAGTGPGGGFAPSQIRHAYGFDQITAANGLFNGDGTGQTIAIVDAYADPRIQTDLATFDQQFGLPAPPSFTILQQKVGGRAPAANAGWAVEIALDVEWAHAMAPGAKILLVEAYDADFTNMFAAVDMARNTAGVSVVSMSWGAGEFAGENSYDSHFVTPSGHIGITFIASAGDSGAPASYPAFSPNVLAVGGTSLFTDNAGNLQEEIGWSGGGGGISTLESQPAYQNGVQSTGSRTTPDVAYAADPNTGFSIYDSYQQPGWFVIGGTSAAAPQWAALIAIANQGLALSGKGSLDGVQDTLPRLYQLPSADFHDITSGDNGGFSAGPGYDMVTGLGTPVANRVVADLLHPPPTVTSIGANPNPVTTGKSTQLSVSATDPNAGATITAYTWSVQAGPSGVIFDSNNGTSNGNTETATFSQAGTYTFLVTVTDSVNARGSATVIVTVQQTPTSITVPPAAVPDGTSSQLSATELDQFGNPLATQPSFTWTLMPRTPPSGSTLSASGLYTAPGSGSGSDTVQAAAGGMSGTGTVTFALPAPPLTPSGLTATAGNAQVSLSWTASARATSYSIYRSTTSGGEGSTPWKTGISATSFTDTGLTNGVTYYYQVTAVNAGGESAKQSSDVSATPLASLANVGYVKTDAATQGSWSGVYGADGYNVSQDPNVKTPSYAQVSFTGQSNYPWAGSTTDIRALQKPENTSDRIAGTWYTTSNFTIDVNLTDGSSHQVALYVLDWDSTSRAETIKVLDAGTGTVLDTRTLAAGSFHNGEYVVWNIQGHVKFEIDNNGGVNAVVSGLFFGGSTVQQTLTSITVAPATVTDGTSAQLSAIAKDQFGNPLVTQPTFVWTLVTSGGAHGTVSSGGLYTAPSSGSGFDTAQAAAGGVTATGTVNFVAPVPPAAPTGLTAAPGNNQVTLSWTASAGATSYKIYRGASNGETLLASPAGSGTTYTDLTAANGTTYYYKVSAVGAGGEGNLSTEVSATPSASLASVSYVKTDAATQGSWSGVYGADGYNVSQDPNVQTPSYAQVSFNGQSNFAWAGSTTDIRALQKPENLSDRIAGLWYSTSNFTMDVNLTDGASHQVSLYVLDWDSTSRAETIKVLDAGTGTVLDTRTLAAGSFHNGEYLVWNIQGHVKFEIDNNGGTNAVVSGLFFGTGANPPAPGSASFVKADTTTQGTWSGVYGADGYNVSQDTNVKTPSYAQIGFSGQSDYTWAGSTSDTRALQKPENKSDRIAGTWYTGSNFTIDVKLTDGGTHQVALYLLDWDSTNRSETVKVIDVATGTLLDTRTLATGSFHNGEYLVWNVQGHVKIEIDNNGGMNAVASGLFFDPVAGTPHVHVASSQHGLSGALRDQIVSQLLTPSLPPQFVGLLSGGPSSGFGDGMHQAQRHAGSDAPGIQWLFDRAEARGEKSDRGGGTGAGDTDWLDAIAAALAEDPSDLAREP